MVVSNPREPFIWTPRTPEMTGGFNPREVLDHDINHLSLYQLTIEPNTIFYKKELNLPNELKINQFENIAKQLLKDSGYLQYEVSSWCKENKKSAHNINYWSYGDFLGVGPGAHSKITNSEGIQRQMRLKKLSSYINNHQKKKSDLENSLFFGSGWRNFC